MLWATGCSHTYGDDLVDKSKSWPFLLAEKLGMDCINNGISGGSNERIVYETMKAPSCDLKIIAWTYKERFTRYDSRNNFQINFNPTLYHTDYGKLHEYETYGKIHYAYWSNTLYNFKLWLQQVILTQRYLESKKQRYVMLNAAYNQYDIFNTTLNNFNDSIHDFVCLDLMNDEQLCAEHTEIQNYIAEINKNCYYMIEDFHITDLNKIFPVGATGHLLEDGHMEIANRIYECSIYAP